MPETAATIDCVLFDLDGTLVDSAPDLVGALNQLRVDAGLPELPLSDIRHLASHGSGALLLAGFPKANGDERKRLVRRFLDAYLGRIADESRLFPGMPEVLKHLQRNGMPWGVVTNKPHALTKPLLSALELSPNCVVSGDSLSQCKPDPAPVIHACKQCHTLAANTLYVGDAERDVIAGRAAGAQTALALWGYLNPAEDPHSWHANYYLESAQGVTDLLLTRTPQTSAC